MRAVTEAARRLLSQARNRRFHPRGALVMAAAAGVIEAAETDSAFTEAERLSDRTLALLIAAAAEALNPTGRLDRLAALALTVPVEDRVTALASAECFLARIGPEWAVALVEELVGKDAASAHGALGLCIAARADITGISVPDWVAGPPEARALYSRQLVADSVARAAGRGHITGTDCAAFSPLRDKPPGRFLLPSEASSYLVAAAFIDPAWALDIAEDLLQTHTPYDLQEAINLTADAAVRVGLGVRIREFAHRPRFIAEQTSWAEAGARSGALDLHPLLTLTSNLSPRVAEELSPNRHLVAGMPLLIALAHTGATEPLVEMASKWRTPPALLADQLFCKGATLGAARLCSDQSFERLFDIAEDHWSTTYNYAFGWWEAAGADVQTRLTACRDVLTLATDPPWRMLPGSLSDLVEWIPPNANRKLDLPAGLCQTSAS